MLAFAFPRWWLPVDASLHGPALDRQMLLNLWIALGLLVLAHVLLFGGLLLRRGRTAEVDADEAAETASRKRFLIEYVPLALLTMLFAYLAVSSHRLWAAQRYTGAAPDAMQVEVTGMQFAWYFRYPGPDATFGRTAPRLVDAAAGNPLGIDPNDPAGRDDLVTEQLVLPAGREVDLTLRSLDVMHGFSVPAMRLKQDAVPGQTQHIHFTPERPGDYAILCTQVCGMGHYRMQAMLRVLSQRDFNAWLQAREARP